MPVALGTQKAALGTQKNASHARHTKKMKFFCS